MCYAFRWARNRLHAHNEFRQAYTVCRSTHYRRVGYVSGSVASRMTRRYTRRFLCSCEILVNYLIVPLFYYSSSYRFFVRAVTSGSADTVCD